MEQSYKEKYEQAIERLKQWDREHPCAGYVLSDRDKFIFPELAESEDEKIRKEIVRFIQMEVEDEIVGNKWLAWLGKQKGNIWGISANWSEEDEEHIDSLLKRLDALCRNKFERTRFAISEDRDWLKSLRPQSRWKPSELQLGCLSDAIEHYNSLGYPAPKLKELYEQLKKLKEGKV